jgi:hypothetical protein
VLFSSRVRPTATRTFRLQAYGAGGKVDTRRRYDLALPHNTLLVMWPPCQEGFQHSVPEEDLFLNHPVSGPARVSLTFRYKPGHAVSGAKE